MFEPLAVPAINRLLRANTWALEKLKQHAGKTALLASPPFELKLTVTETGEVSEALRDALADVTIAATPGVLLRFAARDETAWTAAQIAGDIDFAGAIDFVRRHLVWDFEEDLSAFIGDIGAHRVARLVRAFDHWGRATALNLGHALAEYATHEQPVVASAQAIDAFNRDVDEVRDDVARVEKRIEHLQRRLSSAVPPDENVNG